MQDDQIIEWFAKGLKNEIPSATLKGVALEAFRAGELIRQKRSGLNFENVVALESGSPRDKRNALMRIIANSPQVTLSDLVTRTGESSKRLVKLFLFDRKLQPELLELFEDSQITVALVFWLAKLPRGVQVKTYESTKELPIVEAIMEISALIKSLKQPQ